MKPLKMKEAINEFYTTISKSTNDATIYEKTKAAVTMQLGFTN